MGTFKSPSQNDDTIRQSRIQPSFFDVNYPLASAQITNGGVLITSTAGDYYGFSILTTSAGATVRIFDATTASGKLLDVIIVSANTSTSINRFVPIRARLGIYSSITLGTASQGVVVYSPKG